MCCQNETGAETASAENRAEKHSPCRLDAVRGGEEREGVETKSDSTETRFGEMSTMQAHPLRLDVRGEEAEASDGRGARAMNEAENDDDDEEEDRAGADRPEDKENTEDDDEAKVEGSRGAEKACEGA